MAVQELVSRALAHDVRAVSRLISIVEDRREGFEEVYASIYPHTGKAHVIGVTGPPGSGKSTFVDKMALEYRAAGRTVGVVAVDPTSPFSGGALLGDRLRMQRHALDEGVFIRSMGTRGRLGGLSTATSGAVDVLDAAGFDVVLIETVGVGQSEVEIASLADTVILIQVPGLGDDIQVIKAGIMEIGDVFVVNKKDRPGVERVVAEIKMALDLSAPGGHPEGGADRDADRRQWRPPILMTMAESGEGVAEVVEACAAHLEHLGGAGLMERRLRRARAETMEIVSQRIWRGLRERPDARQEAERLATAIAERRIYPYSAAIDLYKLLISAESARG